MNLFQELLESPQNELVEQAIDDGRIPIRYSCSFVPETFLMTDKLFPVRLHVPGAAGTGRFLEAMSRIFRMYIDKFSLLSLNARKTIPVTAQCSVFAESEVISLLAKKNPPEEVAAGIQAAVSKRCFSLLKRIGMRPMVTVTGGCAKNRGLIKSLSKKSGWKSLNSR